MDFFVCFYVDINGSAPIRILDIGIESKIRKLASDIVPQPGFKIVVRKLKSHQEKKLWSLTEAL